MLKKQVTPIALLGTTIVSLLVLGIMLGGCSPQAQEPEPVSLTPSIEDELQPVHPDEPVSHTFNQRFSLDNALDRIVQIDEIGRPETPGETSMAFNNAVGAVNGTLLKQEYLLRKAEFDLAKFQHRDGLIDDAQLSEKEAAYNRAVEDFRSFWDSFGISD
jgi:hypothetical protein